MSITMIQNDGSNVTPKNDGMLYHHLDERDGVLYGCDIIYSGSNRVTIQNGYILVCGRVLAIEQETILVNVPTSDSVSGRLIIDINTAADPIVSFVSQIGPDLPELLVEDINTNGIQHQYVLATYTASPLVLSNFTVQASMLSGKENAFKTYTASGDIGSLVVENYTNYILTDVTNIILTAADNVDCCGFIHLSINNPAISDYGFDSFSGDDPQNASAGDILEFSIKTFDGFKFIIWKNWSN